MCVRCPTGFALRATQRPRALPRRNYQGYGSIGMGEALVGSTPAGKISMQTGIPSWARIHAGHTEPWHIARASLRADAFAPAPLGAPHCGNTQGPVSKTALLGEGIHSKAWVPEAFVDLMPFPLSVPRLRAPSGKGRHIPHCPAFRRRQTPGHCRVTGLLSPFQPEVVRPARPKARPVSPPGME